MSLELEVKSFLEGFGRNIQRLRRERGMRLADLARAADLREKMLAEIEAGQGDPRLNDALALASALGVSVSRLLTVDPPSDKTKAPRNIY